MFAPAMQQFAPSLGQGNFGVVRAAPVQMGYGAAPAVQYAAAASMQYAAAAPMQYAAAGRAPMGYPSPAPAKEYGYWHDQNAPFQIQQPNANVGAPATLSPSAMAKLKEFTTDHHWRQRSKDLVPAFSQAGRGASGLNYQQFQKFFASAGELFFGESCAHLCDPDLFERFDFNGDGVLEFIQAFKALKCILYEIFHTSGGETIKPIEFVSPSQKGYTIIKELARGGQGAALLATVDKDGSKVVLKTYEKSNPNAGTIEEHIAEMEVLKELQNESYIMHAWDIFQDDKCVYCVNELMAGGDLEALREKTSAAGIQLTQEYFKNIFKQTLMGLDHIHEHGLMHCDLKEPNVMIKTTDLTNPQVAIIDFGLAHVCAGPGMAGGTPGYIPPETNTRHVWYPKGDIFSLGVTFFQLLADKTPYEKTGKFGIFQEGFQTMEDVIMFTATRPLPLHLISGKYPGVMSWLPGMCNKEKKPRPRALQILDNPFFTGSSPDEGWAAPVQFSPEKAAAPRQGMSQGIIVSQAAPRQIVSQVGAGQPRIANTVNATAFSAQRPIAAQTVQARTINSPTAAVANTRSFLAAPGGFQGQAAQFNRPVQMASPGAVRYQR